MLKSKNVRRNDGALLFGGHGQGIKTLVRHAEGLLANGFSENRASDFRAVSGLEKKAKVSNALLKNRRKTTELRDLRSKRGRNQRKRLLRQVGNSPLH